MTTPYTNGVSAVRGTLEDETQLYCNDVIMSAMAFQITSLTIVYSTVYSDADQIKQQRSASLAYVRHWPMWGEFTGDRWIPLTKGR